MKLTEFSVRNRPFSLLVFLCLIALGANAFLNIPRSEDPRFSIPVFSVIVVQPGSDAIELERLVARPVEDALNELDDINKVASVIRDGAATVTAEFFYGTDPDRKYDEVVRQVNAMRDRLPSGVVSIEIRRFRTNNVAVLQTALVSPTASYARMQDLAEELRKRLETAPGVRDAQKWAYPEKEVRITVDQARLTALGLPVERVVAVAGEANAVIPGGAVESGARRFNIKTSGNFGSLDEIRETPVFAAAATAVRLGDVAEVEWSYEDEDVFGRYNGERAVFVTARMRDNQNIFPVRDGLFRAIDEFRAQVPGDIRLVAAFDQSENVRKRLGSLQRDFLIAIALVLVTLLPLGLRASLIVAVSIPLSLAIGVALLDATGFGLNQISIVGMVIALGLLVDDSIVVVENIARFRREGHGPVEAAIQTTRQIAVAVIGTTATVVLAFVPLLMLPGGPGQFIRSLPISVVFTVVASMFVALSIIPFLASGLMRGGIPPEGNWFLRALKRGISVTYRPLLHRAMTHRVATLLLAAAIVVASAALLPLIGTSLFPKAGIPQFLVRIEATEGASVGAADRAARAVEAILGQEPEIAWYFTSVGRGNPQIYYNEIPRERQANLAEVFASLQVFDPGSSPAVLERLRQSFAEIPGVQIVVREFQNGPPIDAPIVVRLLGQDLDQLARLAQGVESMLRELPGTDAVDNPLRTPRTDLKVKIDRAAAGLLGITDTVIDRAVRLSAAGLVAGRFRESDGDEYDMRVVLPRASRPTLDNWRDIRVPISADALVPVSRVAHLEFESAPPVVQRFNRERSAIVTAQVAGNANTDRVTAAAVERLRSMEFPPGYRWELGGEAESRAESFGGFGSAILIAMFGVLAVIVLEFRSFRGTAI
ncbi:MAG TPA: efflux RND transporter permease subunit, partial [Opitutaceae bacterium]